MARLRKDTAKNILIAKMVAVSAVIPYVDNMVLTKEELIATLQNEVRILVHLAGKVDRSKLDYRPSEKQRSILELLQYMVIMGPNLVHDIKAGAFDGEAWGIAAAGAKAMSFDQAVAAIQQQSYFRPRFPESGPI